MPGDGAQWLGWDGARLRWRLTGDLAGLPATELRLDGIAFRRWDAAGSGEYTLECDFPYSPSGAPELDFSVHLQDGGASLLPVWAVRHGVESPPPSAAASAPRAAGSPPRGLRPLADAAVLPARALAERPPVSVVVPIFDSPDCVRRCIASVLRWSPRARLILIDDASRDARIAPLLAAAARPNVLVHRNERNRGYTHSVNLGMALAGGDDVVLLNSDAEVGPRWLAALRLAAHARVDIGTVTAVSDDAGAFSVPELERRCPTPERWTLVQTQRAVLQQAGLRYPRLPTGNGFCLYVKRALLARIGPMDEAAFPQGYGEENDFCQRAEREGFRHLIAGNVFVHHERSASFGHERRLALGAQGMAVLRERYPDYERDVGAMLFAYDRRVLDYRIRRTYADPDGVYAAHPPRPRLLVAADQDDAQAERLLGALAPRQQGYLLRREGERLHLYRCDEKVSHLERSIVIGRTANAVRRIEARLSEWLLEYAIEAVHPRGSAAADGWLVELAARLEIPAMR